MLFNLIIQVYKCFGNFTPRVCFVKINLRYSIFCTLLLFEFTALLQENKRATTATIASIIIPQSGLDDIVLNDFIIFIVYSVIIVTANITIIIL